MKSQFACAFITLLPMCVIASNLVCLVFYIFLGWLYIPYLLWILWFDHNTPVQGGRQPSRWLRSITPLRWFRQYFPASIAAAPVFKKDQTYVFGVHPHGIVTTGVWVNAIPINPVFGELNYRMVTLSENFYIPFFRELLLWLGFISADKRGINYCLKRGISVFITVGGAQESLRVADGIVLDRRRGFIEAAIKHGASLVPIYNFGERELYYCHSPNPKGCVAWFQRQLKRYFHFTVPVFWGNFGIFPRSHPIQTVVGEPIPIREQMDHPTPELIETYHTQYKEALLALHEKYRREMGNEPPLKIIA